MDTVVVGDEALTVEDVVRVANGAGVGLAPQARERIRESRALVDEVLATRRPVYGVNTGVGHTKDDALPEDQLRAYQEPPRPPPTPSWPRSGQREGTGPEWASCRMARC